MHILEPQTILIMGVMGVQTKITSIKSLQMHFILLDITVNAKPSSLMQYKINCLVAVSMWISSLAVPYFPYSNYNYILL